MLKKKLTNEEAEKTAKEMVDYLMKVGFLKEQIIEGLCRPYPLKVWSKHGEFHAGYYRSAWEEKLADALQAVANKQTEKP